MFKVSRDNPAYYLPSVTHNRLPIFQRDDIKQVVAEALCEARENHKILLFAYVIMPDHNHLLTDNRHDLKDALRYVNGITAHRVIQYLKSKGYVESLEKLRIQERSNKHKYSVFSHHPNGLRITGEQALWQKINYINLNPVRAGLVDHPNDYLYSSARSWHGRTDENEPLITDHTKIHWR